MVGCIPSHFILSRRNNGLVRFSSGKPLDRKAKSRTAELIREKRDEVEEDEKSSEMQKFMLDLSSKEDMSRLKER